MSKKLLLFGIPVFATSIGSKIIGYIDTLILTYFRPLAEVGVYNVILPSSLMLLFLGTAISSVIFPMSSELWAKKDKKKLSEGLRLLYRYSFIIAIPGIFTVFAFANFFLTFLFGEEYAVGALALQILLVGVLFYTIAIINNNILAGIGQPKVVTKIILFAALVNIILNLILIPSFGINGAAVSTALSYILILILSTYKATRHIKISFPVMDWIKTLFAGICFIAVIFIIKEYLTLDSLLEVIISGTVAGLVYLFLIFILKIVDMKELKKYAKILR